MEMKLNFNKKNQIIHLKHKKLLISVVNPCPLIFHFVVLIGVKIRIIGNKKNKK